MLNVLKVKPSNNAINQICILFSFFDRQEWVGKRILRMENLFIFPQIWLCHIFHRKWLARKQIKAQTRTTNIIIFFRSPSVALFTLNDKLIRFFKSLKNDCYSLDSMATKTMQEDLRCWFPSWNFETLLLCCDWHQRFSLLNRKIIFFLTTWLICLVKS